MEPVSPDPPALTGPTLLTQSWLDATMLHWPIDPAAVAPLLPAGTVPDLFEGTSHVGLIAFRMHRIGWLSLPGIPYLGSFPETNVRLYSVDERGRRGVVFLSLEASRLLPVVTARAGFRLPYRWARMAAERRGDEMRYRSVRREPGQPAAHSRISVRIGGPIAEPTEFEHWASARWRLHFSLLGRTVQMPNEHPRWPLHRAELLECEEDLIAATGLPVPDGPPGSVLFSPGVKVRFAGPRHI